MSEKAEDLFEAILIVVKCRNNGFLVTRDSNAVCPGCGGGLDFIEVCDDGTTGNDRKVAFACNNHPELCNVIMYAVEPYRGDPA